MKHPDHFDFTHLPRVAYEKTVEQAKLIEEAAVQCGSSPTLNSRITRYRKIVEEFSKGAAAGRLRTNFDWVLLHQALCEISQLALIVKVLLQRQVSEAWSSLFAQLVSGQLLPQAEEDQSKARDVQFELNIAAHCKAAGYEVQPREPDVLVLDPNGPFGIAAKRPKSPKTLERHIRKAGNQIQKSGMNGIVAVDLSLIHNPENRILLIKTPQDGIKAVQKVADRFVQLNRRRVRSLVKAPDVFGLLVHVSNLCFDDKALQFSTATRWTVANLCEMTDARYEQLRKFTGRFAVGVGQDN